MVTSTNNNYIHFVASSNKKILSIYRFYFPYIFYVWFRYSIWSSKCKYCRNHRGYISYNFVYKFGACCSKYATKKIMDNEEFKLIYNKALDLISRREHSKYELFLKVKRKFPDRINVIDNWLGITARAGMLLIITKQLKKQSARRTRPSNFLTAHRANM